MQAGYSVSWKDQFNDFVRSLTGAFLFGVPFIYTMEMWWIAAYMDVWKLLAFLAIALLVNIALGRMINRANPLPFPGAWEEAIYNTAIGILGALIVLLVLNRITPDDPLREVLAKILLETIPLSIGAAVTRKAEKERQRIQTQKAEARKAGAPSQTWDLVFTHAGIALAGGLFLSFPLASTEEIQLLAAGTTDWHLLVVVLFSILVTYMIIYRASLAPTWAGETDKDPFPILTNTLMTYSVALLGAVATLYLFDQVDLGDPFFYVLEQTLILGLPATIGGAAGRHLI